MLRSSFWTAFSLIIVLAFLSFFALPVGSSAAINQQINYQGQLTDSSGVSVTDGNYIIKFRLYTSATGATTTNIWEEIRTATGDRAAVTNGLFSVMLGSSTALTNVNFNQTLYLGVEVCGTTSLAGCDGEMTPRKILGAVPAAFEAQKLSGLATSSFLRADAVNSTSTTGTFVTINQTGTGNILDLQDGGTTVFTVLDGGNVGIGTTSPYRSLSVSGNGVVAGSMQIGTSSSHQLVVGNSATTTWRYQSLSTLSPTFSVNSNSTNPLNALFRKASEDSTGSLLVLSKSRGTNDLPLAVEDGDDLGTIYAGGYYEAGKGNLAANITFAVDGTVSSAELPTRITFSTTPTGSLSATERLRIDNQGRVGINTSSPDAFSILTVKGTTTDNSGFALKLLDSSDAELFAVRNDGLFNILGAINASSSATSTFAQGLNVDVGCFAIAGVCVGGANFVGSGFAGMLTSWASSTGLTATSGPTAAYYIATSTTATSTFANALAIGTSTTFNRNKLTVAGDISSLAHSDSLRLLSSVSTGVAPDGIYVQDKYAYVINVTGDTLQIFDVSNPLSPTSLATIATNDEPSSVHVSGKYAYVFTDTTLQIFDVSNPSMPYVVGSAAAVGGDSISGVYVSGKYAYLAGFDSALLYVFDIGNPAAPILVSTTATGANPQDVYIQGKYAYVVTDSSSDNVEIYDVSNPDSPVQMATADAGNDPREIVVQGPYAYVVHAQDSDFLVFNVASSTNPFKVASTTLAGNSTGLSVSGRYAYVANYNGGSVQIVDVASSTVPTVIDTLAAGGSRDLIALGRYLYVTDVDNNLFKVIDTGGAEFQSAIAHSLDAGSLRVYGNAYIDGDLQVETGLNVGFQGVATDGAFSSRSTGTASYIGYRLGIGTTSPAEALDINGNIRLVHSTTTLGIIYSDSNRFIHNFGTENTFTGVNAGNLTMTGTGNAGFGHAVMSGNTTGSLNTGLGAYALAANTEGGANTAIGNLALSSNTTGDGNIAIGYAASGNVSGDANTAIGQISLQANISGGGNTAIGYQSLLRATTSNNSALGLNAGAVLIGGGNNTFLGAGADVTQEASTTITNATAIGANAIVGASNSIVLGGIGSNAVNVGIGTTSPYARLSVVGEALATYFTATSTVSTSTFSGKLTVGTTTASNHPTTTMTIVGGILALESGLSSVGISSQQYGGSLFTGYRQYGGQVLGVGKAGSINWTVGTSYGDCDGSYPTCSSFMIAHGTTSDSNFVATSSLLNENALFSIDQNGRVGVSTGTPAARFGVYVPNASTNFFRLSSSTDYAVMLVDNDGHLGLSTSSPWRTLSVDGTVGFSSALGSIGASENALCIDANGTTYEVLRSGGNTDCTVSSRKYKHDIENLSYGDESALDKINALRPVSYLNNDDNDENIGFIAEEVFHVDERLVFFEGTSTTDTRGVKYNQMTALLTKAIQELYQSLKNLTGETISYATAVFGKLTASAVEIGSPEKPSGITLYDEETGEPYCLKISGGKTVSAAGKCGEEEAASDPEPLPDPTPDPIVDSNPGQDPEPSIDPEPEATSTDPIVEPDPVVNPAPEPEITPEPTPDPEPNSEPII